MLVKDYALEGYRILDVLGVGGFGITYVAVDETLEEKVAIKEFVPAGVAYHAGDTVVPVSGAVQENYERLLKDFIAESRNIARIRHANVIRVRRCFKRNGTAYLVMDYEDGEDFQAYLQGLGRPPGEAELVRVIGPLVDGLQAVHAAGLIHRDIKPSNIFIRRGDGSPVLLDFGAARQEDSSHFTAVLTSGYAPIEQYEEASRQGPWTDIYGVAAVLYRAVTGNKPMSALTRLALDRLVPATEACAGRYSEALLRWIDSGLAVAPENRPRSVADWRAHWLTEATTRLTPACAEPPQVEPPHAEPENQATGDHTIKRSTAAPPVQDRDDTVRHGAPDTATADEPASPVPVEASPPDDADPAEKAAWISASAAHTAAGYRAYLERYPEGTFARRARTALAATGVQRPAPSPSPPPPPPLARSDPSGTTPHAESQAQRVTVRVFEAPTTDQDDRPGRFEFVRPSVEILGLLAISGFVAMIVATVILRALFHDQTLANLLMSTVVAGGVSAGIVLCSRETNGYSATLCGIVSALLSLVLFVLIFGKYLV
jgi:serine/threonine protein kinase